MHPIDKHLKTLAVMGNEQRRQALEQVLQEEKLEYQVQIQEKTTKTPRPVKNYLLLPDTTESYPLFCAHYDAVSESTGANDNAAALCILIDLAVTCKEKNIVAGFAFFDAEEDKHRGAKFFLEEYSQLELQVVINLDMCGFGDRLTVYSKGSPKKAGIQCYCEKERLQKNNGQLVPFLPESDDKVFSSHHQPVLSISVMPADDVAFLKALATYRDNLLGKPPEYYMMLEQMEVFTTMHGGYRDGVEWVEDSAMQQVRNYLLDALTAEPPAPTKFRLFRT